MKYNISDNTSALCAEEEAQEELQRQKKKRSEESEFGDVDMEEIQHELAELQEEAQEFEEAVAPSEPTTQVT